MIFRLAIEILIICYGFIVLLFLFVHFFILIEPGIRKEPLDFS